MSDRLEQTLHLPLQTEQTLCSPHPSRVCWEEELRAVLGCTRNAGSLTFTPTQTGARRAPASGRCRTSCHSSAGTALGTAGADLECTGPPRVLLGWVSREPVPSYPTLTCHLGSEGGEKPSALSSRGENLLDCLLLGNWKREKLPRAGTFHICHPPGGCDPGEALCPPAAPRVKASAPLQAPESRPCAVRCPCPASRHPPASPLRTRARSEPGACPGRRGLEGRELRPRGRSQPGGCWSPQAASGGRRGGRREGGGDGGFPWSRRVTAPVPIPGFSYE